MKDLLLLSLLTVYLAGCDFNEASEPQRRQQSYFVHRAGYEPVRGTATFTEEGPGKVSVEISLVNTDERVDFPAHLHFGTISEAGELAFRLEDVAGRTGVSNTLLDQVKLTNGEIFTFDMLVSMNGSI